MNHPQEIGQNKLAKTTSRHRFGHSLQCNLATSIKILLFVVLCACFIPSRKVLAHGFNANHVDIVKTFGRKYRVIIKYTHVELGEYREAHIDFDKKDEAIKAFQDLVKGADFFLGDIKNSIHFHNPPEQNQPF
ncbi:MAG: hypothetical protein ACO3A4_14530 [Silvanigrellaceae bacterium]